MIHGHYKHKKLADCEMGNISQPVYRSAIVRRFEFAAGLSRMSVICKNEIDQIYRIFTKGAPEKIATLCLQETLPHNFNEVLHQYAKEGLRVLAVATKSLN